MRGGWPGGFARTGAWLPRSNLPTTAMAAALLELTTRQRATVAAHHAGRP